MLLELIKSGAFELSEEFSFALECLKSDSSSSSSSSDTKEESHVNLIAVNTNKDKQRELNKFYTDQIDIIISVFASNIAYRNQLITVIDKVKKSDRVDDFMQTYLQSIASKLAKIAFNEKQIKCYDLPTFFKPFISPKDEPNKCIEEQDEEIIMTNSLRK
jgi:hypothetical protein